MPETLPLTCSKIVLSMDINYQANWSAISRKQLLPILETENICHSPISGMPPVIQEFLKKSNFANTSTNSFKAQVCNLSILWDLNSCNVILQVSKT